MKKEILISPKKRKAAAKQAEIDRCYEQREEQILELEKRNPFSAAEWKSAWRCGWLRHHGISIYDHPSPFKHYRRLFRHSNTPFFKKWREYRKERHEEFRQSSSATIPNEK